MRRFTKFVLGWFLIVGTVIGGIYIINWASNMGRSMVYLCAAVLFVAFLGGIWIVTHA